MSIIRQGNTGSVVDEVFELPNPKGSIIFHNKDLESIYSDFNSFIRFSMKKPITLWYKIPLSASQQLTVEDIYHIPVEVSSIEKSEVEENGSLASSIEFKGTGFWKHSQSVSEITSSSVTVFNEGDFDAGIEITLAKGDGTSFLNPTISFMANEVEYGITSLNGEFTKIYMNSKDSEQSIKAWNGSETELDDPFSYINFDAADGVKTFPFPKLKNGMYTTITFSYDGIGTESQNFVIIYDKEYASV